MSRAARLPSDSSNPETVLLRLFRCMTESEQERLIHTSLEVLGERCTFSSHHRFMKPDDVRREIDEAEGNLDDRLKRTWPPDWPGQSWVELDSVGDAGAFIEDGMGEPLLTLFGLPLDECNQAECFADDYLRAILDIGMPLPSDYTEEEGGNPNNKEQFCQEFKAFQRHWRERILQSLEEQNRNNREL